MKKRGLLDIIKTGFTLVSSFSNLVLPASVIISEVYTHVKLNNLQAKYSLREAKKVELTKNVLKMNAVEKAVLDHVASLTKGLFIEKQKLEYASSVIPPIFWQAASLQEVIITHTSFIRELTHALERHEISVDALQGITGKTHERTNWILDLIKLLSVQSIELTQTL